MEVGESIVPSLSGVGIDLPAVSLLGSGPVWNSESLEDGSWLPVEGNVSNTLQKSLRVEVLSVNVMHEVGLLMELVHVEVLDSDTCSMSDLVEPLTNFPGLLDVESIGDPGNVRVNKADYISDGSL